MDGLTPDHSRDGESRVSEIIHILAVTSTLSTLAVLLRCYSRGYLIRSFGADDLVMIPAQMLTIASAVAIGLEAKYGLGRHSWMQPPEHQIPYMKAFYTSIVVYNVAVCLTKISILLQYYRLFSNTALRPFILCGLFFLSAWGITLSLLLPMVCMPVARFWDHSVDGVCLDNLTIWYVMAGVNVTTDFALFTMPIPVIKSLNLPKRHKAMLVGVFALGIFPCAVSIYRIRTLGAAAVATDPTWDNVDAATFSFLELTVGVITVCLPTLRPLLVRIMPRVFGTMIHTAGSVQTIGGGGGRSGRNYATGRSGRSTMFSTTSSATRPAGGKSSRVLDGSESMEELRSERPKGDQDIEFSAMDLNRTRPGPKPSYIVSVVADGSRAPEGRPKRSRSDAAAITATTTVTQHISFSGQDLGSNGEKEAVH